MEQDSKPTTIAELAIHLVYIKDSLEKSDKRNSEAFQELKEQIKNVGVKFCTQKDFEDLSKEVQIHEEEIQTFKGYKMWLVGAVGIIILFQGLLLYSAKAYVKDIVGEVLAENYDIE